MAEGCTHDCSTCGQNCPSKNGGIPKDQPNKKSNVAHIIAVMSGKGGDLILDMCKRVLADEYPELNEKIYPSLPDEKFRRVGQSMAAASLPEKA